VAAFRLWGSKYVPIDAIPRLSFVEIADVVATACANTNADEYELLKTAAYYAGHPFKLASPHVDACAHDSHPGVYSSSDEFCFQLDALVYALLWNKRMIRECTKKILTTFAVPLEDHELFKRRVTPWLLKTLKMLPSTETEKILVDLYTDIHTPLIAAANRAQQSKSVYQKYRDFDAKSPSPAFKDTMSQCAQATPSAILSPLLPRPGLRLEDNKVHSPLLQACAVFSITLAFLSVLCNGESALICAETMTRVSFKIVSHGDIKTNSASWCSKYTVYYMPDVAYIAISNSERGKYELHSIDEPPSPFVIVYNILKLLQITCLPSAKLDSAIKEIENDSPVSERKMPRFMVLH
jgi:hypothetical protein